MTVNELYANLFQFNPSTYHRWKKEERPILKLLNMYCGKDDLEEFITTGKIKKFEKLKENTITDELILTYAMRALEKFNTDINKYGYPVNNFWNSNNRSELTEYNLLHSIIIALEETKDIKDFKEKVSEYSKVQDEEGNEYAIIEIENELEEIEIKTIIKQKEKSIRKLKSMINIKRPKLGDDIFEKQENGIVIELSDIGLN